MFDLHSLHRAPLPLLEVLPFPSIDTHNAAAHFSLYCEMADLKKKSFAFPLNCARVS